MADEKLDPDFADLPLAARAEIECLSGVGLHHAPAAEDEHVTAEAFRHPEQDAAGTTWEPNWEPIETYRDGEVVMLDDGDRQLLGRRELGMWMEVVDGDERAQPDYHGSGTALEILEARAVAAAPIATVRIPHRIPPGIHGAWLTTNRLLTSGCALLKDPDLRYSRCHSLRKCRHSFIGVVG